jgi:hypothetical protein
MDRMYLYGNPLIGGIFIYNMDVVLCSYSTLHQALIPFTLAELIF